jgi:hypothetical protein
MDYTAIPNRLGWEALMAVGGLVATIAAVLAVLFFVFKLIDGFKNRSAGKNAIVSVGVVVIAAIIGGAWWGGLSLVSDKMTETDAAAVENMKSNLNAKYVIDLDGFDVQNPYPAKGEGTYTFRNKDEASVVKFSAEFDEHGEPFLVVDENMTREDVQQMLR